MTARFSPGRLSLISSGSFLPGEPISNERMLDSLRQHSGAKAARLVARLSSRLGIRARHFTRSLEYPPKPPSHSAVEVCVEALTQCDISPTNSSQLGYMIGHTTTPSTLLPANIAWVADSLSCSAPFLELRQACTGFANALQVAESMLNNDPSLKPIAIVGSEVGSVFFDHKKAFIDSEQLVNYAQMGDGAGAVVLGQYDGKQNQFLYDMYIGHIGLGQQPGFYIEEGGANKPSCEQGMPRFRHDPTGVVKNGVALFLQGVEAILNRGHKLDDFAYILPHQVNGRLAELLGKKLNVAPSRIVVDADTLGNLGSAAIWVSFDRLRRSGKLKTGDKVLVLGAEATKYLYGGFIYQH